MIALVLLCVLCADSTSLWKDFDSSVEACESARLKISSLGDAIMHERQRFDKCVGIMTPFDANDAMSKLAEADKCLTEATDNLKAGKDRFDLAMERWDIGTMMEERGWNAVVWYDAAAADFAASIRWFQSAEAACDRGRGWVSCAKGIIDPWYTQATMGWWQWFTTIIL